MSENFLKFVTPESREYVVMYPDKNITAMGETNAFHVSDIFATIQGEMPFAGRPSVFLRLAACNRGLKDTVACNWCDTDFRADRARTLSVVEVVEELLRIKAEGGLKEPPLLVITGGEPMLQANMLRQLIVEEKIHENFLNIQFETNGDLFGTTSVKRLIKEACAINDDIEDMLADKEEENTFIHEDFINFVVSPKRSIKDLKSAPNLIAHAGKSNFFIRLVISGNKSSPYYNIPQVLLDEWPSDGFYLSPITVYARAPLNKGITDMCSGDVDIEATRNNVERARELAFQYGLRLSLQSHAYIGLK